MRKKNEIVQYDTVIEMSAAINGSGKVLSERIGLTPGLYGYVSAGVSRNHYDDDKAYQNIYDEPRYTADEFFEDDYEDSGFVTLDTYCVLRREIRNKRNQSRGLKIFRESLL